MKTVIVTVTTAIENIIPICRIAPTVAPANPYMLRSTELMIAFVFGEENNAKPNPRKIKHEIT